MQGFVAAQPLRQQHQLVLGYKQSKDYASLWSNRYGFIKHRVIDLGGLVSFGGVLTFKSAQAIRDTLARCPAGTFMLETDSPYLAPEPHRGQRNEPALVRHVAEKMASLRGESLEELARHTNEAAEHFFRFRPKSI